MLEGEVQGPQGAVAAADPLGPEGWTALTRVASLQVPTPKAAMGPRSQPVSMATGQALPGRPGRCPVRALLPERASARPAASPLSLCLTEPRQRQSAPRPLPLLAHPALTSSPARRCRHLHVPAWLQHPLLA